jgi:sugar phosphate isomerase/epimerase
VPNAIGCFKWLSPDAAERRAALAEVRRTMDLARAIGRTGLRKTKAIVEIASA